MREMNGAAKLAALAEATDKMARVKTENLGRCFELVGEKAIFEDGTVVHGSIQGFGLPRIKHAWFILPNGRVWEPATAEDYDPGAFGILFGADPTFTYTADEAKRRMLATEHFGPWEEYDGA